MDLIQEEQQLCSVVYVCCVCVCEFAHGSSSANRRREEPAEEKRRTEKSQSCCADAEPNGDDYANDDDVD